MFNRMVKRLETNRVIDSTTGCWLYTGNKREGYGYFTYRSKNHSVHRLSAHVWLGIPLNSKEQVNHKQICPNRHCFNPEHIYRGNQSQNLKDYYELIDTGKCPKGHDKSFMYEYLSKDGKRFRWCRQCRKVSRHKYFIENKK